MTTNPELRARILEWQKRHEIRDDDPAMALIELLEIYGATGAGGQGASAPAVDMQKTAEAIQNAAASAMKNLPSSEELRMLATNSERTAFLLQDLKESISKIQLAELAEQFKGYNEGIDLATKKMAVIIKEGDDLLARLGKVAAQINPVARGSIVVLMIVSAVIGWLIGQLFF